VSEVRLFYDHSLGTGYESVVCSLEPDGSYRGTIPASVVSEPAVRFYVVATDGQAQGSYPAL